MCFDWQKHLVLAFVLVGFGAFDVEGDGAAAYGAGQKRNLPEKTCRCGKVLLLAEIRVSIDAGRIA